jgi:streptomycin 6-kinase
MIVSEQLAENAGRTEQGRAWLERLPATIAEMSRRWSLEIGSPFVGPEVSASWVAPVRRADGTTAVLKLPFPHMEGEHELEALRFWNGDPTVRLLDAEEETGAMLLERCEPGSRLRELPEERQDEVIAVLLGRLWRLWRSPADPHPFRPLSEMLAGWSRETLADRERWPDAALVREGLELFETLARDPIEPVLLATDLHAGNVLRAEREPWLVIDPKPFVGDAAYDATQHLLNCPVRLRVDPRGAIRRLADLLEVDDERVRLWTFARAAAEPREDWADERLLALARTIGP